MSGVEELSGPGQAPRDLRQIKYFQKSVSATVENKDDIAVLMDMFAQQNQDSGNICLHELTAETELSVFIATQDHC